MASTSPTTPDTLVTLKINVDGTNKRFKLPLRDLGASTLPAKLRSLLDIPPTSDAVFERYSDSAAAFVILDPANTSVYKQLYRAAKAKLKLRLKVAVTHKEAIVPKPATVEDELPASDCRDEPVPALVDTSASPDDDAAGRSRSPTVTELQRGFEEMLINSTRPRPTASGACPVVGSASCGQKETGEATTTSSHEIPVTVTRGATARDRWFAELAGMSNERQNAMRNKSGGPPAPIPSVYSVYCNSCESIIPNEHYHCSTCDNGDFDLCQACVTAGVVCNGESHWLIKRFVRNGKVITSTTETIAPKLAATGPETTVVEPQEDASAAATRTCNSCIQEWPEDKFVTCTSCEDYDLCIVCHVSLKHGHDPKHAFTPAAVGAELDLVARLLLTPGRNQSHNAICDGCDTYIYGVRHKCVDCPDWDYCSACIGDANLGHPGHRFVPMFEPSEAQVRSVNSSRHVGIYCDGPLCNNSPKAVQSYITGDRYKCAVCHDTDFCASCEANPSNPHNKTHPLIKFKTPVRNVSVTTMGDHDDGRPLPVMGDRPRRTTSKSTETSPTPSVNAATQVQTVADLEPAESNEKAPVVVEAKELPAPTSEEDLTAHFTRDAVADGTALPPNTVFEQTWFLRNGGDKAWPAGCTVKFTGGDNMCAVDPRHPASIHELVSAGESTTCYTEVVPGQETGFTVLLRTPSKPGTFISYWRLTTPSGNKFGHRLWCDIRVQEPAQQADKQPVQEAKGVAEGSQMIFPKLEKESPGSSIRVESQARAQEPREEAYEFDEFFEESLGNETEDGFLTDEEYDILDASDEEYLAEQAQAIRK